ncbi:hypothetical protein M434DRAFT_31714 [Hypoxylon sp. CO27-5]|nr:hypothetical protein M434DRAFT_31714 [Hypoxylon sp. CO27-5]
MAEPELPDFEIYTDDNATHIGKKIEAIQNYVFGIELEVVLPTETENIVNKIYDWIPYAIAELNVASVRFTRNSSTWDLILEMKDTLRCLLNDVTLILDVNDDLKEDNN